ncbi:MAG TPA: ATP-binding protein, partial [Salinimicrobium sp.]|nr:ATP-binding protein [Salinimicrobium sp.]
MEQSKKYGVSLFFRILILFLFLLLLAFAVSFSRNYIAIGAAIFSIFSTYNLYKFVLRRFRAMDDFFESVKYRDFSRWFVENRGPRDLQNLHKGFNEVNRVVKEINTKKETQYLYLQKILEMVDIGIIAYNLETGEVLWANDFIKKTLDFPSFKNINFVARRNPELYQAIFETFHSSDNSVNLKVKNEKLQVLLSDTIFQIEKESFKLIVLQNIDETLDRNESEAWKKLLSVMTHEIMNSIAPISSLADTLQTQVQLSSEDTEKNLLELEDLNAGLTSIKKRSEGLMKFAKTYRSLNKVTHLNLEKIYVDELFNNIRHLMQPSLKDQNIQVDFVQDTPNLQIEIDAYLIEQVLINLLLNAVDACKNTLNAKIVFSAKTNLNNQPVLRI